MAGCQTDRMAISLSRYAGLSLRPFRPTRRDPRPRPIKMPPSILPPPPPPPPHLQPGRGALGQGGGEHRGGGGGGAGEAVGGEAKGAGEVGAGGAAGVGASKKSILPHQSEEHTSELQSHV